MSTRILATLLVVAGCPSSPPALGPMPWLEGFTAAAASATPSSRVTDRMARWQVCEPPCGYGGIEVVADVAPGGGQTVLASYSQGVIVLDRGGSLRARAPGLEAAGSADELVAVAVGDAQIGEPVIAVTARIGGHRESAVRLEMFRVGTGAQLERVFAAVVENHEDGVEHVGAVRFVPNALYYRAPGRTTSVRWDFDATLGRYVDRRPTDPRRDRGEHAPRQPLS